MKRIGVLGAGTMGAGIIQVLAQSGYDVVFVERSEELADKGMASVAAGLSKLVKRENFKNFLVKDGYRVEVFSFVGGG